MLCLPIKGRIGTFTCHLNAFIQAHSKFSTSKSTIAYPLWRNWLARLTVNQEVGSSSLPGGDATPKLFFWRF
ncbi:hypothetical protein V8C43DRAFT_283272 [Trichoderma afarasin]